jgi:hypothetical protein
MPEKIMTAAHIALLAPAWGRGYAVPAVSSVSRITATMPGVLSISAEATLEKC